MTNFPPQLPCGKWHTSQEDALLVMEQQGDVVLVKWGNFHFTSFTDQDEFLDFISECEEEDRQFFEVLLAGKPQLMFADLDGAELSITREALYAEWQILMKKVFKDMGLTFKPSNVRLLNSTGDKISAHWSYSGLSFENSEKQKEFWLYVDFIIERDHPNLCFSRKRADEKLELMNVLDIAVYSKNRAMRTIYSHKSGSDRVLQPCKMKNGKIVGLKQCNPLDYLIYTPDATEFYDLKIPKFEKLKHKYLSQNDIQNIILQFVPNVEIIEVSGRMFKLRNVGTRTCIINGEENLTDNSYVIWKRDGLYFGCHDSGCNGRMKKLCEIGVSKTLVNDCNYFDFTSDYTYQKFQNQFREHKFESFDALKETMQEHYPKVIARILHGEGSYIKKDVDTVDIVKKLGSSGFNMYYKDENEKTRKIGIVDFLYMLDGYGKYDCKLDHTECLKTNFNLWNGFQAKRIDLLTASDEVKHGLELMKTFLLEVWANNDQNVYNYIISWFAGLFTDLKGINMVALAMISGQGTGKGFFLQFLKYIIRGANVCESQGIGSITQKHNTVIQNKRLVVINEMSSTREEFKSNFDKIKTYISDPVVQIEPKGVDPYQINNISNYILFTNHRDAIIIEESDRRYAVFEMSPIHINDTAYFANLAEKCFNQDVANAFYTYLLDFEAVNIRVIPDTNLRREMMTLSKSTPLKFLDAIREERLYDDDVNEVFATDLYQKYADWCRNSGERSITATKFGTIAKNHIETRRTKKGIKYILPPPQAMTPEL